MHFDKPRMDAGWAQTRAIYLQKARDALARKPGTTTHVPVYAGDLAHLLESLTYYERELKRAHR